MKVHFIGKEKYVCWNKNYICVSFAERNIKINKKH